MRPRDLIAGADAMLADADPLPAALDDARVALTTALVALAPFGIPDIDDPAAEAGDRPTKWFREPTIDLNEVPAIVERSARHSLSFVMFATGFLETMADNEARGEARRVLAMDDEEMLTRFLARADERRAA